MLPGKKLAVPDYLAMLRRRWWLIALPAVLTTFVALVMASRVPNVYQSDMLIAIDPQRVPDAIVRSTVTMPTDVRMEAIRVKVLSRTNLQRMIEDLELYPRQRQAMPMTDVVDMMDGNIEVQLERGRPTGRGVDTPSAFHLRFAYADPQVAARVTQELGELFVSQNTVDRTQMARATNEFLEVQLEEARKRLEEQERRLESFRMRHGKSLPTQIESNRQAIGTMQMQVQSLVESIARDRDRKLMLERLYREASNAPPTVVAQAPGGQQAPLTAAQQLAAARLSLAGLRQKYTDSHPDVVRAEREVEQLETRAAAEAANAPAGAVPVATDPVQRERLQTMAAEIESLDRQTQFKESEERRIRTEIAQYQNRIESVPAIESDWVALTRDYDTQQNAYKELLAKAEAARLAVNLEDQQIGEAFRIVDAAQVPVRPMQSLRMQINAIGLALGLFAGLALAALLEIRDTSFRSGADVLEVLDLPVLASVPYVATAADVERQRRRRLWATAAGVVCVAVMGYVTWTLRLWSSVV